jgi:hypothetical protein
MTQREELCTSGLPLPGIRLVSTSSAQPVAVLAHEGSRGALSGDANVSLFRVFWRSLADSFLRETPKTAKGTEKLQRTSTVPPPTCTGGRG